MLARDAIHHSRSTDADGTSGSTCAGSVIDPSQRRVGAHIADIDGGNVVALSQVVTAWAPREILVVGRAISQDVREALDLPAHLITWTDNTAGIEPARYDLIWVYNRFALADDNATECALRQIRGGLGTGGRLVVPLGPDVGVASPDTDLFDRWFRFHRTGAELTRLAVAAGFAADCIVVRKDPVSSDLLIASLDAAGSFARDRD